MITSLEIRNFKCFDAVELNFADLTLFTGFNSGGKSSAIQALLLLSQGLRGDSFPAKKFPLNGWLTRLGAAGDVIPAGSENSLIEFVVATKSERRSWSLKARAGDRHLQYESSELEADGESDGSIYGSLKSISFLSAIRPPTPDDYPLPDVEFPTRRDVGFDGRFAAFEYNRSSDDEVSSDRWCPGSETSSFRKQVDHWLSWLFPGAQANVQLHSNLSRLGLQFRVTDFGDWRRPANVGYGYSYVFPIIVALLSARIGQIVVIDSPEAHLHPRAQSQMGQMLATFARAGVQLIVESHSDHVLNGIRLAVKNEMLEADKAKIAFFAGASAFPNDGMRVIQLSVGRGGTIERWPEGFFDQIEVDLAQL